MKAYKVTYLYVCEGRRNQRGDSIVIAEDSEKAVEGFKAVHPDGAAFHYVPLSVERETSIEP